MQHEFYIDNGYSIHLSFRMGSEMILFLHGYLQSAIVWQPFLQMLPVEIGFIAPDLPGHGESSCFGDDYFTKYCDQLKSLLDSKSISSIHVVGHSMGGYAALHLLKTYPNLIKSVTLLHATPLPDTPKRLKNRGRELDIIKMGKMNSILTTHFEQLFAPLNRERLSHYSHLYRQLAQTTSNISMAQSVTTMANRGDYIDVCKSSSKPIQIVFGQYDLLLPQERTIECESLLPNLRYFHLKESGHTSFVEQPNEVLRIIKDVIFVN